jgi:hypothetical protein
MLLVTASLFVKSGRSYFPFKFWLPWILYLVIYIVLDFSFYGLQLSLQYLLPILAGFIAGTFTYNQTKLLWLFQGLLKTTGAIYLLFVFYKVIFGFPPHMAATPMFLVIAGCLGLGIYFGFYNKKMLGLYAILFLMPFLSVTRMAIAVFLVVYVFHFANTKVPNKLFAGTVSFLVLLVVVNSQAFKNKTFYDGEGDITEVSLDYYENTETSSSGRLSWSIALAPGLKKAPIWGNGPRADAVVLGEVIGLDFGEAHNDYLSVRYNYGWVGLGLLLAGMILTFLKLWRFNKSLKKSLLKTTILSTLTLFLALLMFMYSDNILKYSTWFTNYFFAAIGICFSIYKKKPKIPVR